MSNESSASSAMTISSVTMSAYHVYAQQVALVQFKFKCWTGNNTDCVSIRNELKKVDRNKIRYGVGHDCMTQIHVT